LDIATSAAHDTVAVNGGAIMSLLAAEFDLDAAKRVWSEEQREEERAEIAREMIADGEPIEKVVKWTKLSHDFIKSLNS